MIFEPSSFIHERLADVDALLDDRNHRLELMDRGRDRGLLGFLLRLLGECGDLGAVLGTWLSKSWLGADQSWVLRRRAA